jgi:hypothetical protein
MAIQIMVSILPEICPMVSCNTVQPSDTRSMLQANTSRLVATLACSYDRPFDDATVEGLLSFVKDFLAPHTGSIGCESVSLDLLECLQAVVEGQSMWSQRIAEVMSNVVLRSCGARPAIIVCVQGAVRVAV